MTKLPPELRELPVDAIMDGELVALGDDGWPDFPSVCERILNGRASIPLVYVVFDLLELDGERTTHLPFRERRRLLEGLRLHGPHWQTSAVFDDGEALFAVAQERGLDGVVAKRRDRYRPGERGWTKTKNHGYWRWEIERQGALRKAGHLKAQDGARDRRPTLPSRF
jgi:bifunctional non-homologous end joining protein LigD